MFSGIVETLGNIVNIDRRENLLNLKISPQIKFDDLNIGDSVSVNGTCLTVTNHTEDFFDVSVIPETLKLTNLDYVNYSLPVNLERALKANGRNGGHNVQGHIDCIGEILELMLEGTDSLIVKVSIPKNLSKYIVHKGFIAIDGMSLTVVEVNSEWFKVALIPHTQHATIAHRYQIGTKVNLEVDILGKYVEKFIEAQKNERIH